MLGELNELSGHRFDIDDLVVSFYVKFDQIDSVFEFCEAQVFVLVFFTRCNRGNILFVYFLILAQLNCADWWPLFFFRWLKPFSVSSYCFDGRHSSLDPECVHHWLQTMRELLAKPGCISSVKSFSNDGVLVRIEHGTQKMLSAKENQNKVDNRDVDNKVIRPSHLLECPQCLFAQIKVVGNDVRLVKDDKLDWDEEEQVSQNEKVDHPVLEFWTFGSKIAVCRQISVVNVMQVVLRRQSPAVFLNNSEYFGTEFPLSC